MRLTIKVKLGLVFLVFFLTAVILGTIGIYSLRAVNNKTALIVENWLPGVSVSKDMAAATSNYRVLVFKHIASDGLKNMQENEKQMEQVAQRISGLFTAYEKLIAGGEYASESERKADQDAIDSIKSDWMRFQDEAGKVVGLSRQGKRQEAMKLQEETCIPLIESIQKKIDKIMEFNEAGSSATGKEAADTYDVSKTSFLIVIVAALLTGSCVIFWIGSEIVAAIQNLVMTSNEIAKGNLRVSSKVATSDELGELAAASNQMAENMRNVIEQIQNTAEQVAASSQELTASADQSAKVTQNIAESIAHVSETTVDQADTVAAATEHMENVAAGIEESTTSIQVAAEKTKSAVDTAKQGTDTIAGAVSQMNNIEETVTHLAAVVAKLGERSKEIGQIVDTISGIAGQTNLLALNAAIEAARAGEMGKGFAVVAEEVRKLAEQSQSAAKEIELLITEIQADTDQAVSAMDKGTQEVKTGANVVQDAGDAFAQIYEMVGVVNQHAEEIAKTMEDLANGTQNVVDSIRKIDDSSKNVSEQSQAVSAATEEQSASMEQIAASSRSLAQTAQNLTQMSGRFKI